MIEKMKFHSRDDCGFVKKINEIIDKLNEESNVTDILCRQHDDLDERLTNLEQCPINDRRLCQPLKPEYDPDDVKFTQDNPVKTAHDWNLIYKPKIRHEIAKEGTFEWALIQMKNGKKVKSSANLSFYIEKQKMFYQYNNDSNELVEISINHLLSKDWKVVSD